MIQFFKTIVRETYVHLLTLIFSLELVLVYFVILKKEGIGISKPVL